MDENEWAETRVISDAYNAYLDRANESLQMAGTVYHLFAAVAKQSADPTFTSKLDPRVVNFMIESAQSQVAADFEALHTMMILTGWAQVEALVVDICVAMLRTDPTLLSRPAFDKVKLPAIVVAMEDLDQRLDALIDIAFDSRYKFDSTGKGKFEKQLEMVGLHGTVPDDLEKGLVEVNAVRNVLAHNGGIVNRQFVERCPDSGYSMGDKVALGKAATAEYVIALNTYTTIVTNRFRVQNGLVPVQCNRNAANKYTASFDALYPDAIDPRTLSERAEFRADS
jgi:hypothetical protein